MYTAVLMVSNRERVERERFLSHWRSCEEVGFSLSD